MQKGDYFKMNSVQKNMYMESVEDNLKDSKESVDEALKDSVFGDKYHYNTRLFKSLKTPECIKYVFPEQKKFKTLYNEERDFEAPKWVAMTYLEDQYCRDCAWIPVPMTDIKGLILDIHSYLRNDNTMSFNRQCKILLNILYFSKIYNDKFLDELRIEFSGHQLGYRGLAILSLKCLNYLTGSDYQSPSDHSDQE